jgi:hypothetical protein
MRNQNDLENTTWTVDGSGENVDHEPNTETETVDSSKSQIFRATVREELVLNRSVDQMTFEKFCMTMARLKIDCSEEYEIWWKKVDKWNPEFPEFPATKFGIEDIWKQVRITRGYLRLLNALEKPLSAFE